MAINLQEDVIAALGPACARRVRLVTVLQRYSLLIGAGVGLLAGLMANEIIFFVVVGGGLALATFHYSESYLVGLDRQLFSTPEMSKREIFDRFFAKQVERDIGLQMTEPEALVADGGMTVELRRSIFKQRLQSQLETEFRAFDWKYFVREVVRYSR